MIKATNGSLRPAPRERVVDLFHEWDDLQAQMMDLRPNDGAGLSLRFMEARLASIRDNMLSLPASSFPGIAAKYSLANRDDPDGDLRDSAEQDLIRLFYG